jgi:hypothetical protein
VVENFDVVEVCCETVVACVEPEVCGCVVSEFIFVVYSPILLHLLWHFGMFSGLGFPVARVGL